MVSDKQQLRLLVENYHLREAIDQLGKLANALAEVKEQAAQPSKQLSKVEQKGPTETEGPEAIEQERDRIPQALRKAIDSLPDSTIQASPSSSLTSQEQQKKYFWSFLAGVYLLVGSGLLFWALSPMNSVYINATLRVQRANFRYLEEPATFTGQYIVYVSGYGGKLRHGSCACR